MTDTPEQTKKQPQRRWLFGNYGLSIVLAILFFASWIGQFIAELSVSKEEATQHGQSFEWGQFWPQFWQSTLENWQSEFLQLLTFVILTAYLIHRGSAESKDSDEEMQAALSRIEARLDQLDGAGAPAPTNGSQQAPTSATAVTTAGGRSSPAPG
jgi:hypothetical protein